MIYYINNIIFKYRIINQIIYKIYTNFNIQNNMANGIIAIDNFFSHLKEKYVVDKSDRKMVERKQLSKI